MAIPIGLVDGLPVSMQIIGRRHAEQLLLELARMVELERPWTLVAPDAPPETTQVQRRRHNGSHSDQRSDKPAQTKVNELSASRSPPLCGEDPGWR